MTQVFTECLSLRRMIRLVIFALPEQPGKPSLSWNINASAIVSACQRRCHLPKAGWPARLRPIHIYTYCPGLSDPPRGGKEKALSWRRGSELGVASAEALERARQQGKARIAQVIIVLLPAQGRTAREAVCSSAFYQNA